MVQNKGKFVPHKIGQPRPQGFCGKVLPQVDTIVHVVEIYNKIPASYVTPRNQYGRPA